MVCSEIPLVADFEVAEKVWEDLRVALLAYEYGELQAWSVEKDDGLDMGAAERLMKITDQVKYVERQLELSAAAKDLGDGFEPGRWKLASLDVGEAVDAPLHTKTVPNEQVRRELDRWVPSMVSEYNSLTTENDAVTPFTGVEAPR